MRPYFVTTKYITSILISIIVANTVSVLFHNLLRALLRFIRGVGIGEIGFMSTNEVTRVLAARIGGSVDGNLITEFVNLLAGILLGFFGDVGIV